MPRLRWRMILRVGWSCVYEATLRRVVDATTAVRCIHTLRMHVSIDGVGACRFRKARSLGKRPSDSGRQT